MYSARVIADSIGPCNIRLVSILLRYPRFVHAEFLRHRSFSYSVASTRAIPSEKLRQRVRQNPATIAWWGKNQRGMVAQEELTGETLAAAKKAWDEGMEASLLLAIRLEELGLHKQIANRVLEPWMDVEQLTTGTDFTNFFALRRHRDAQPEIQRIANDAFDAIGSSSPLVLLAGEWHLPFIVDEDGRAFDRMAVTHTPGSSVAMIDLGDSRFMELAKEDFLARVSAARTARTSYLNHEGRLDHGKDLELFDRLVKQDPGHWSPLEHVCRALGPLSWRERLVLRLGATLMGGARGKRLREHGERFLLGSGNLVGWQQLRKLYDREYVGGLRP